VTSVAVSPSGGCILTGCKDQKVRKWNAVPPYTLMEWECTLPLAEEDSKKDCNRFVAGYEKLFIMKVDDGSVVRSFKTEFETEGNVSTITAMDSNKFVTGHQDGSIQEWNSISDNYIYTFKDHEDRVTSIAKVDNSHFISGSADCTFKLWNIQSKDCIHTFFGHTGPVTAVMCMPTGGTVLTGSNDKSIRVWSLNEIASDVVIGENTTSQEEIAEEMTNTDLERGTMEARAEVSNTGDVEIYEGIKMTR